MKGPLPPTAECEDFLSPAEHAELLSWTLANRAAFQPSTVIGGVLDPAKRVSERTRSLGAWTNWFTARIEARLPWAFAATGTRPFTVDHYELEVAAHGDGAHFARHTDIPIGPGRQPFGGDGTGRHERLLSVVYYYHREPRRFSGGALRLHRFGSDGGEGDYRDIEPRQNSLVAFPSWVTHEVMRVSVPSHDLADDRFAVNCWLCAVRAG